MKLSSSEPPGAVLTAPSSTTSPSTGSALTEAPVLPGSRSTEAMRTVRFDRPLRNGPGQSFGDAEVERQVLAAVEAGREQGRAAGYAAGWAQGRQVAAEEAAVQSAALEASARDRAAVQAAQVERVLGELARVTTQLSNALVPAWQDCADSITDGALQIARAALGRELDSLDEPTVTAVRTALRTIGDPQQVQVRMHPDDLATLGDPQLPQGVQLVPDPQLPPGEVRAATPVQRLVMNLPQAVAAAEAVLRG